MARLVVALPLALESSLADEIARHGHDLVGQAASAAEAAALVERHRPEALIVSAQPRYLSERVLATCDESGVRVVALTEADADRRYAASLGLIETTDAASPWPVVELAVAGPGHPATAARRTDRGTVITVWGPAGAPGRTTLAIGIAAELAALGHSVVLGDVDTHGASVAPALGMLDESPGFAAACRLAGAGALSIAELDRIGQRYESPHGGFTVLTGIGRPSRWPELTVDRVSAVIEQCRQWCDYLVLDCGSSLENDEELSSDLLAPRRNGAAVTAVREADKLVAVGAADPVGLSRFLRAYVDLEEVAATRDVTVVMNRVRATAIGMNPYAQVTRTLSRFGGIEAPVLVPHDQAVIDGAVLSGRTLVDAAPKSAVRAAIMALVRGRLTLEHVDPQ